MSERLTRAQCDERALAAVTVEELGDCTYSVQLFGDPVATFTASGPLTTDEDVRQLASTHAGTLRRRYSNALERGQVIERAAQRNAAARAARIADREGVIR